MTTENNTGKQPIMVHIGNYSGTEPIQIIYREDKPVEVPATVEAKIPDELEISGIITAPADWLEKRYLTFDHNNAHVAVMREQGIIDLVINERDCAPAAIWDAANAEQYNERITKEYRACSTITGKIQFTDIFKRLHINEEDTWIDPQKLSAFFRLNRSIFPDAEEGMKVVSILKNIKAKINADYEKTKDTYSGSRTEFYQQSVEHNLPKSFEVRIPIFKGEPAEKYTIEFDVDIVDGKILLQLKSPAINDQVSNSRDALIDAQLERIKSTAADLVIIEM